MYGRYEGLFILHQPKLGLASTDMPNCPGNRDVIVCGVILLYFMYREEQVICQGKKSPPGTHWA